LSRICGKLLLCLIAVSSLVLGQDRGTITGTVTDNSGAIVPGAKITLQNPETGFSQSMVSSSDGVYSFLYLASGKYDLSAEKEGFRKAGIADVLVQVGTTSRVDIRLQVGAVQEVVEVQSQTPLLQTDRSDLGRVVDNRAIQQLPLFINGGLRSNLAFSLLTPGANASITNDPDTAGTLRIAGGVGHLPGFARGRALCGARGAPERGTPRPDRGRDHVAAGPFRLPGRHRRARDGPVPTPPPERDAGRRARPAGRRGHA